MTHPSTDRPVVFPDWSPYHDLESAARSYLRDPELALDDLTSVLGGAGVLCFTLERFVNDVNGVWQEVAACDGSRLILWHGEDVAPGDGPPGSMTSSTRVLPLSVMTEVGIRRRLLRDADGGLYVDALDVYILLSSFDDGAQPIDDQQPSVLRQDALRFVKTLEDGGSGQIGRLEEFAKTLAALVGRPI